MLVGSTELCPPCAAAETSGLVVRLQSGLALRPTSLEAHDDPSRCWLVWDLPQLRCRRAVAWRSVAQVTHGDEHWELAALDKALRVVRDRRVAEASAASASIEGDTQPRVLSPTPPARYTSFVSPAEPVEVPAEPARVERVAQIVADASTANWDRDPHSDGLVLYLEPRGADGQTVPARGTVTCELVGYRPEVGSTLGRFFRMGYWSRQLRPDQLGLRGARYELAFQRSHPDTRPDWSTFALLLVRVSIPGQGTFHTTVDWIRVRSLSTLRDKLQQATGGRYLPSEGPFNVGY